jgi:hypothetical protein
MTLSDSQQAIVDYLVTPAEQAMVVGPIARGWTARAGARSGGSWGDRTTVHFIKTRAFEQAELHAVAFSTVQGQSCWLLVRTIPDDRDGYHVQPVGGGGGRDPKRDRPWVNLTAQWDSSSFRAGGSVTGQGADRARLVRMSFADGTSVEDTVDGGTVLFEAGRGVAFPAEVQVIDEAGNVLASYPEFEDFVSSD